jgi:UDP-N-acetylmuramate: L-alanyl-gamma-D-glutamyl-meso-diaminopimelate ligase
MAGRERAAGRWVLAVAGTHGKTTTTSLLAWILEDAGLKPGFLIGGVPQELRRVGAPDFRAPFFVIEADEYDTAFCDKRSKFVHYRPRTAILNNLEFDHADIFADLAAIETQFHHLVRIIPRSGLIVANAAEETLPRVIQRGCWTPVEWFGDAGRLVGGRGRRTDLGASALLGKEIGAGACPCRAATTGPMPWRPSPRRATWGARRGGLEALARFEGVKRRLELRGTCAA